MFYRETLTSFFFLIETKLVFFVRNSSKNLLNFKFDTKMRNDLWRSSDKISSSLSNFAQICDIKYVISLPKIFRQISYLKKHFLFQKQLVINILLGLGVIWPQSYFLILLVTMISTISNVQARFKIFRYKLGLGPRL